MRGIVSRITPVVLLNSLATADSMHGRVTRVEANRLSVQARYYPDVSFTLNDRTEFLCHRQAVPVTALRVGDSVEVEFHTRQHGWEAFRGKIQCEKAECEARESAP